MDCGVVVPRNTLTCDMADHANEHDDDDQCRLPSLQPWNLCRLPCPPLSDPGKARVRVARKGDALLPCKLASFRAPMLEELEHVKASFRYGFQYFL